MTSISTRSTRRNNRLSNDGVNAFSNNDVGNLRPGTTPKEVMPAVATSSVIGTSPDMKRTHMDDSASQSLGKRMRMTAGQPSTRDDDVAAVAHTVANFGINGGDDANSGVGPTPADASLPRAGANANVEETDGGGKKCNMCESAFNDSQQEPFDDQLREGKIIGCDIDTIYYCRGCAQKYGFIVAVDEFVKEVEKAIASHSKICIKIIHDKKHSDRLFEEITTILEKIYVHGAKKYPGKTMKSLLSKVIYTPKQDKCPYGIAFLPPLSELDINAPLSTQSKSQSAVKKLPSTMVCVRMDTMQSLAKQVDLSNEMDFNNDVSREGDFNHDGDDVRQESELCYSNHSNCGNWTKLVAVYENAWVTDVLEDRREITIAKKYSINKGTISRMVEIVRDAENANQVTDDIKTYFCNKGVRGSCDKRILFVYFSIRDIVEVADWKLSEFLTSDLMLNLAYNTTPDSNSSLSSLRPPTVFIGSESRGLPDVQELTNISFTTKQIKQKLWIYKCMVSQCLIKFHGPLLRNGEEARGHHRGRLSEKNSTDVAPRDDESISIADHDGSGSPSINTVPIPSRQSTSGGKEERYSPKKLVNYVHKGMANHVPIVTSDMKTRSVMILNVATVGPEISSNNSSKKVYTFLDRKTVMLALAKNDTMASITYDGNVQKIQKELCEAVNLGVETEKQLSERKKALLQACYHSKKAYKDRKKRRTSLQKGGPQQTSGSVKSGSDHDGASMMEMLQLASIERSDLSLSVRRAIAELEIYCDETASVNWPKGLTHIANIFGKSMREGSPLSFDTVCDFWETNPSRFPVKLDRENS